MAWHEAAQADAIGDDEILRVEIGGRDIAVCSTGGELFAFDNVCTHQYALLSDGFVEDGQVECPLHQGRFDCRTGKPLCAPVTEPIRTYPTRVEGGKVLIDIG
jgi:nitrite reductase/ring-hydroxylating ferredoxin subunit